MSRPSPLLYPSPAPLSSRVGPAMNGPGASAEPVPVALPPAGPLLLDALDHRQDEVLRQLEVLNGRIEQLVADCQGRSADRAA